MTKSQYPQCRIVPLRMLSPETAEKLLNQIVKVEGVRRLLINGPNLPKTVPYGPARGKPNPNTNRRVITVNNTDVELQVQAGTITLEVEDTSVIDTIRGLCDAFFAELSFPCSVQEGKFMKTEATLSDYAKYGPNVDKSLIGMTDPRKKEGPVIIQGLN